MEQIQEIGIPILLLEGKITKQEQIHLALVKEKRMVSRDVEDYDGYARNLLRDMMQLTNEVKHDQLRVMLSISINRWEAAAKSSRHRLEDLKVELVESERHLLALRQQYIGILEIGRSQFEKVVNQE